MTEEHVWVTLADGKRLYVGKVPELPKVTEPPLKAKRKRPQYSPPVEIFSDAD